MGRYSEGPNLSCRGGQRIGQTPNMFTNFGPSSGTSMGCFVDVPQALPQGFFEIGVLLLLMAHAA